MIELLGDIVLVFTALQLFVVLVNLIWNEKLASRPLSHPIPTVSVLIPARNEERNIRRLLDDLLRLPYPPMEIMVCNDQSTDRTAAVVEEYAALHPSVKLFHSPPLPRRWTGKNFACHQLAAQATGEYLLFLDADVRIKGHAIERATYIAEKHKLKLLTVFPRQLLFSFGEKAVVPLMNYILLTLLPLITVRIVTNQRSLAAANGQFMLFHASEYRDLRPHKRVRKQYVEDIRIARYYKSKGLRVGCFTGDDEISCRMYPGFAEAINGFARSLPTFFGESYTVALLFWGITTAGFLFVFQAFSREVFYVYLAGYAAIRVLVSLISHQSVVYNVLLCPIQQLCMGWVILYSLIRRGSKRHYWKGRKLPG